MKQSIIAATALIAAPAAAFAGLKLTRAGYESPSYKVERKADGFEIRTYSEIPVASTKMAPAAGKQEQDSRFMQLFRYIDKGNTDSKKIAMTTPVFMEADGRKGAMSFVIPSKVAAGGAPSPSGKGVYLDKIEGGKFAVARFKGKRGGDTERAATEKLRAALKSAGIATKAAPPLFAYYDPPWTPKALRRNEVFLRVK